MRQTIKFTQLPGCMVNKLYKVVGYLNV